MSTKFLYGASVQGIQSFIYKTNELKDIVGASQLVEDICTGAFDKYAGAEKGSDIIRAAGNVKFLFDERKYCENAVLNFPKDVMQMADGITISQAVVEYNPDSMKFSDCVDELEKRLRTQRNIQNQPMTLGFIGLKRSPKTGLPVCSGSKSDLATIQKQRYTEDANKGIASVMFGKVYRGHPTTNISKLTGMNDWLAVIHADGNGLGMVVSKVGKNEKKFKEFSKALDLCTKNAAYSAYHLLEKDLDIQADDVIPFRPIILGGDDLTVVCRADLALTFVRNFLSFFESETQTYMSQLLKDADISFDHLTACAGIAYIKSSYPFYYGYNLAESLCEKAKSDAKADAHLVNGLAPSCVMFHKVQDSFIENYDKVIQRELTPAVGESFMHGPYYLFENDSWQSGDARWTIDMLMDNVMVLAKKNDDKEANAIKSHLRQWMSAMHENTSLAAQLKSRTLDMLGKSHRLYGLFDSLTNSDNTRDIKGCSVNCYPVYDILSQVSLLTQETKRKYTRRYTNEQY